VDGGDVVPAVVECLATAVVQGEVLARDLFENAEQRFTRAVGPELDVHARDLPVALFECLHDLRAHLVERVLP